MGQLEIKKATKEDLQKILDLQYIAYQSEADLFGTQDIPLTLIKSLQIYYKHS